MIRVLTRGRARHSHLHGAAARHKAGAELDVARHAHRVVQVALHLGDGGVCVGGDG